MKKFNTVLAALLLFSMVACESSKGGSNETASGNTKAEKKSPDAPGVGQALKTEYFEVTVSKVEMKKVLKGGEYEEDVKADKGEKFLVLTTSFKNIDKESRMLDDGSVFINIDGKDYEFDKSELVTLDGYGLFFDQINPLTSKTTKIVYKVPEDFKGAAFYQPGRADSDEKIFLGDL